MSSLSPSASLVLAESGLELKGVLGFANGDVKPAPPWGKVSACFRKSPGIEDPFPRNPPAPRKHPLAESEASTGWVVMSCGTRGRWRACLPVQNRVLELLCYTGVPQLSKCVRANPCSGTAVLYGGSRYEHTRVCMQVPFICVSCVNYMNTRLHTDDGLQSIDLTCVRGLPGRRPAMRASRFHTTWQASQGNASSHGCLSSRGSSENSAIHVGKKIILKLVTSGTKRSHESLFQQAPRGVSLEKVTSMWHLRNVILAYCDESINKVNLLRILGTTGLTRKPLSTSTWTLSRAGNRSHWHKASLYSFVWVFFFELIVRVFSSESCSNSVL